MVNSQEIVERTFYISLLYTALKMGVTLDPDQYLPLSEENQDRFQKDIQNLSKFIPIFGMGNNQSRGAKTCPRITLELQAYYPGDIGIPAFDLELNDVGDNYQAIAYPFDAKDITIDVHLVANTQEDLRLLHTIMYYALPAKGYIAPYFNDFEEWKNARVLPSGNLFIEIGNFYDKNDVDHGILEKVYTYICKDCIVPKEQIPDPSEPDKPWELVPINDISVLLQPGPDPHQPTEIKVPNNT